jgi:hypothetical protein
MSEDPEYPDLKVEDLPQHWRKHASHLPRRWWPVLIEREKGKREYELQHGVPYHDWWHEEMLEGGNPEAAKEVSRERALARGCSPELVELMYGPSVHKKENAGKK